MAAIREDIEVQGPDGLFSAYLSAPDAPNGAAVLVLQEIFGVNANIREIVARARSSSVSSTLSYTALARISAPSRIVTHPPCCPSPWSNVSYSRCPTCAASCMGPDRHSKFATMPVTGRISSSAKRNLDGRLLSISATATSCSCVAMDSPLSVRISQRPSLAPCIRRRIATFRWRRSPWANLAISPARRLQPAMPPRVARLIAFGISGWLHTPESNVVGQRPSALFRL